jgi:hypothetical protein
MDYVIPRLKAALAPFSTNATPIAVIRMFMMVFRIIMADGLTTRANLLLDLRINQAKIALTSIAAMVVVTPLGSSFKIITCSMFYPL